MYLTKYNSIILNRKKKEGNFKVYLKKCKVYPASYENAFF